MYLISHDISDSRSRRRGDIHRLAGPARREERRRERERKVLASTKRKRRNRRPTRASRTPGAVTLRGDDSLITARAVEFPRVPSSSVVVGDVARLPRAGKMSAARQRSEQGSQRVCGAPQLLRILIKVPDDSSEPLAAPPPPLVCTLSELRHVAGNFAPDHPGKGTGLSRGTLRARRQSTSAGCDTQIKRDSEC